MTIIRVPSLTGLAVLLITGAVTLVGRAAEDDDALRKRALALNEVTGTEPMDAQVRLLLQDKDKSKKLLEVAARMARGKDQPFNYNAAFVLARVAQEVHDLDTAEVMYRVCVTSATKLQSGQKMASSFGGLIDLYFENKKFDKTVKLCREFLELKGDPTVERLKPAVIERMVQAMARQGKIDEALKLVDNFVEAEAKDGGWWSLQLKGYVLREGNRYDDAAKIYETVLERIQNDKTLKDDQKERFAERNRYVLSGVYVDLKQIDKAAGHLQTLLKKKPDDPTYNNDLGYIWADHDMNLDEAEKLIRKAIDEERKLREKLKNEGKLLPEEDKDNAAYLDSLGWVLFKKKDYKEAEKYLKKAVDDPEGMHIEIMDHLGDVYLALKQKDQAVAVWKKALELPNMTKREQERKVVVEKKLKDAGQ
jgi:tetratricopeptide (TPR) repeat protein